MGDTGNTYRTLVKNTLESSHTEGQRGNGRITFKLDLIETSCVNQWWMELHQDHVQWQALVLVDLKLWLILTESCLVI